MPCSPYPSPSLEHRKDILWVPVSTHKWELPLEYWPCRAVGTSPRCPLESSEKILNLPNPRSQQVGWSHQRVLKLPRYSMCTQVRTNVLRLPSLNFLLTPSLRLHARSGPKLGSKTCSGALSLGSDLLQWAPTASTYWKSRISSPTPGFLSQNVCSNKIPSTLGFISTLGFKKLLAGYISAP